MPRLRNAAGVVINVSEETAKKLGSGWKTAPKRAPAKTNKDTKSSRK